MPFQSFKCYRFQGESLPEAAGVYAVTKLDRSVIYIGRTDNLKRRMAEHCNDRGHCMHRHSPGLIIFEPGANERDRIVRERTLIAEYNPPCNKT